MKQCLKCGSVWSDSQKICSNCGNVMTPPMVFKWTNVTKEVNR